MIDGLIDLIYDAAAEPEGWLAAIRELCRTFGAHSGTLAFTETTKSISQIVVSSGVFETDAIRNDYMAYYRLVDPAVRLFSELRPGEYVLTSRAWSPQQLGRLEFYNDFYRKIGLGDSIGANLIRDRDGTALVTIQRPAGAKSFTAREAREFAGVSRHLRRALQLRSQLDLHVRLSDVLDAALAHVVTGVVALDAGGRVRHWNRLAQGLIESRDGLALGRTGYLEFADPAAKARFAVLCGPILKGERNADGGEIVLARPSGKGSLTILVAPPPGRFGAGDTARPAVLLLIRQTGTTRPDLASRMSDFGLTAAELDLLADLAAGQTLKEHCDRRRVTINTGRFHLKSLFSKTGARGQADLVRIALTARNRSES